MTPRIDPKLFRDAVSKYVKHLICARWKQEPDFLSAEELGRWKPLNIHEDTFSPGELMERAAMALADLNLNHLDRCPSGGIATADENPPIARLSDEVVCLFESEVNAPEFNATLRDCPIRVLTLHSCNHTWVVMF